MKQIHWLFMFVLLSLIVVGCATTKGTIWGGRYQAPLNNFTIAVPNFIGLKIDDGKYGTYGGRVSFHGDFGDLWAVTYLRLPENSALTFKDNEKRDAAYSGFLKNFAVGSLFSHVDPETRIVHEEFLGEGENRAFFAVVSMKEGSAMFDVKQNKRLDSIRGLLIFHKRAYLYMVESEMNEAFIFDKMDPYSLNREQLESAQSTLKRIKGSMVFK